MGEGDPKTGEHPRGDLPDPRGTPSVSNRTESGKPVTGFERGGHSEEPGHAPERPAGGGGGGGAPTRQEQTPPPGVIKEKGPRG